MYYLVHVYIPLAGCENPFRLDEQMQEALGTSGGSGVGFGARDMEWEYKTNLEADEAKLKLIEAITAAGEEVSSTDNTKILVAVEEYEDED